MSEKFSYAYEEAIELARRYGIDVDTAVARLESYGFTVTGKPIPCNIQVHPLAETAEIGAEDVDWFTRALRKKFEYLTHEDMMKEMNGVVPMHLKPTNALIDHIPSFRTRF